jgi:peptide subunit release factor 1 (eRF1)
MRIQHTLKRLAARGPSPWPVLSVYVNTRPIGAQMTTYRPFLKKRMHEELKAFKLRSPEHESLVVDFARIQHYLDYDLKEFARGAAVFACYADDDVFDAMQVPVEFPEQLVTVSSLPTLHPLLRVADRYRRAAVLVANTNTARLFTIGLGAIELRREVRNPVLHKAKAGGGGDASTAQHHVEEEWRKHARQAVAALEDVAEESAASWILIGGDEPILSEIETMLPKPLRERLLGRFAWDIRIPESELASAVQEVVEAREAEQRRARAEELVAAAAHGPDALGLERTIQALREARVNELIFSDAFPADARGWACRSCRTFDAGPPVSPCPVCGKNDIQLVSLQEEIGAVATAQNAAVRFVEARAVAALDARGGVGAFVRYR